MTKDAFLATFPEFAESMVVRSKDGEKLGSVLALREKDLVIEKGFLFPHDYLVLFEQVDRVHEGELILKRHSEDLLRDASAQEADAELSLQSPSGATAEASLYPSIRERVA